MAISKDETDEAKLTLDESSEKSGKKGAKCPVCKIGPFADDEEIAQHHNLVHQPAIDQQKMKRKRIPSVRLRDPGYVCPNCDLVTPSGAALGQHMVEKHGEMPSKFPSLRKSMERKVKVEIQDMKELSPYYQQLKENLDTKSSRSRKTSKELPRSLLNLLDKQYYNCNICYQAFDKIHDLEFHIKTEHRREFLEACSKEGIKDDDGRTCPQCLSTFSTKASAIRHYLSVHLKYSAYSCKLCDFKCSEKRGVLRHLKSVHNKNEENNNEYDHVPKPENYEIMDKPIPKTLFFIA